MLSEAQRKMLQNLEDMGGTGPDRPCVNKEDGRVLMRRGLIEAVDPPQTPGRSKPMPYVYITPAGRTALEADPETPKDSTDG